MSNTKTVMSQAANTLTAPLEVEDVFSTYLYTGNGSTQTITNGIDLDGEGGLVWIKNRDAAYDNVLVDTERGVRETMFSNSNTAQLNRASVTSFNSNGFTIGDYASVGQNTNDHASWTFRKAPKFFTCLTYSGTGSAQNISHDLGSVPGTIIVKRTSATEDWLVYHRSTGNEAGTGLNETAATYTGVSAYWNSTTPTDSVFTVGTHDRVNTSGQTYVAYLFAHNDGDGGFNGGDIIKCGSYTGNGADDGPTIDLGFEPQWLLVKRASGGTAEWALIDNMRGFTADGSDAVLKANAADAEGTQLWVSPNSTGFKLRATGSAVNASGSTYIYIAIRRGTKVPESATEVFDVQFNGGNDPSKAPVYQSGFVTDMAIVGYRTGGSVNYPYTGNRLMGIQTLETHNTDAEESGGSSFQWDFMNGFIDSVPSVITDTQIAWMWKRAPGYFDAVAYTGNSTSGRTVSHNLGVAPEMMWVKNRSSSSNWQVYHKNLNGGTNPANYWLKLNDTDAEAALSNKWNDTEPTQSVFSVGNSSTCNASGDTYIAYLFASLPGISKVGSITGTGSDQTIDCGFTSGARFVLIKRTSSTSNWWLFDAERGIAVGNDPMLRLDTTEAEANTDIINPHSSGFTINSTFVASGVELIFYAIA